MDRYTHYTQWNWPEALLAKLDNCYSVSLTNSFVLLNNAIHNVDKTIDCDFGVLALYSQLVVTTTLWKIRFQVCSYRYDWGSNPRIFPTWVIGEGSPSPSPAKNLLILHPPHLHLEKSSCQRLITPPLLNNNVHVIIQ